MKPPGELPRFWGSCRSPGFPRGSGVSRLPVVAEDAAEARETVLEEKRSNSVFIFDHAPCFQLPPPRLSRLNLLSGFLGPT